MILEASQRGGARDLALHLLKEENEHVEVHALDGFVSTDLVSALNEVRAVSKGTRAKQYLFSLSLNPPPGEQVSTVSFEKAIAQVEERLNLGGQPRAIVFHEKDGRRHCHAVWSRIDTEAMKAIPLPHTRRKLMDLSRSLYIEHGWTMPAGMVRPQERDPKNFTLAQWQQAKRVGQDAREIKQIVQDCWATSDSQRAFAAALDSHGYRLARGDRRGFVIIDQRCEVYSVAKWAGIKAKQVREKLKEPDALPSVSQAKVQIANTMATQLGTVQAEHSRKIKARAALIATQKEQLLNTHKRARIELEREQRDRCVQATRARQARFRRGLLGLWDRATGRHRRIRAQNEQEASVALQRDRAEKDQLVFTQLEEWQALEARVRRLRRYQQSRGDALSRDIDQYREISDQRRDAFGLQSGREQNGRELER